MNLKDLQNAWNAAVQSVLLDQAVSQELRDELLLDAAGLHVRTDLSAGAYTWVCDHQTNRNCS